MSSKGKTKKSTYNHEYPYRNHSIIDLPDEIWQPLLDYDHCLVSNYGRVKSTIRDRQRITHQRVYDRGGIPILSFRVYIGKWSREFTTAYAVYSTFIGKLDFDKYKIEQIDGDGFNLRPENLLAVKRPKHVLSERKYYKQQLIAATASMYKYPYQNLSLVDIDGEVWKPFPVSSLSDYYAVSNKGRIKSLERICKARDGGIRINAPSIMKQRVQRFVNPYTKEENFHLSIGTHFNYTKNEFTICRIVYEAFVGSIDDPLQIVQYKDKNPFNNTPDNLYLSNRSELINHMLKTGQRNRLGGCSDIGKWSQEEWTERYDSTRRPVSQFDLDGNFIRTFMSRREAAESLGIKQSCSISAAASKKIHTVGGFQWRNGSDQAPMKPAKIIKPHLRKPFRAKQAAKYDFEGRLIEVYPSVSLAAKKNHINTAELFTKLQRPERTLKKDDTCIWRHFENGEEIPKQIDVAYLKIK